MPIVFFSLVYSKKLCTNILIRVQMSLPFQNIDTPLLCKGHFRFLQNGQSQSITLNKAFICRFQKSCAFSLPQAWDAEFIKVSVSSFVFADSNSLCRFHEQAKVHNMCFQFQRTKYEGSSDTTHLFLLEKLVVKDGNPCPKRC
ncbi:uncharacterized protein LOC131603791 [Vicia villosa]|uniref:uncharacterized protein LOC131603791 n=1 Tax=Vicia villosa TaxID=3911 RepID=UPI00273C85F8|nr:uncharacterized protein LOC131603791 [Vicia villosa]